MITLRRGAVPLALFFGSACLPARQITVGETQVGQGLLYQSSNPTYDKFFSETHAVQLSGMGALDDEGKARLPLEHALGIGQTTPVQLADLTQARAKKVGPSGSLLHLSVTGLPAENSGDKPTNVTVTLSVSDDAAVALAEREFVRALQQSSQAEAELIDKFFPVAAKARQLSSRSSELSGLVNTDFAVASQRSQVIQELGAAKLILDSVAERSANICNGAMSFLRAVAEALPASSPAGPVVAKADPAQSKTKKNGAKPKVDPAAKPKLVPISKSKPESISKPKPVSPAPPSKSADDFNP